MIAMSTKEWKFSSHSLHLEQVISVVNSFNANCRNSYSGFSDVEMNENSL